MWPSALHFLLRVGGLLRQMQAGQQQLEGYAALREDAGEETGSGSLTVQSHTGGGASTV